MANKPKISGRSPTPVAHEQLQPIISAILRLHFDDLQKGGAWQPLDELSSNTQFEGIEPNPDGIYKVGDDDFEAVANVYVTLNYGDKSDPASMSDSYPAIVSGKIDANNSVQIESIKVDTSSFYK